MKISGKDIYLSSIHDSGGGQIVAQIDKYTLDDLVVTSDGLLVPSIDKLPSNTLSPLRQVITVDPLIDALFLSTKHAGRDMTPEQVRLGTPVKLKLWYDLVVGTDGSLHKPMLPTLIVTDVRSYSSKTSTQGGTGGLRSIEHSTSRRRQTP